MTQMSPIPGDVDANFELARRTIPEAREREANLPIFPELSLTGYPLGQKRGDLTIEAADGRIAMLGREAGDTSVILGFYEEGDVRTYNSAACLEDGKVVRLHRKLYPPTYGVFEERKHFSPGQSMRAFGTKFGRMAILICNDAWQPTLGFLAVQDYARVLVIPINRADSRFLGDLDTAEYWHDITRFYGRMFECYVVFVNRVGVEGELNWGNSHAVDPYGNVTFRASLYKKGLITADLDPQNVLVRRRKVPLLKEA